MAEHACWSTSLLTLLTSAERVVAADRKLTDPHRDERRCARSLPHRRSVIALLKQNTFIYSCWQIYAPLISKKLAGGCGDQVMLAMFLFLVWCDGSRQRHSVFSRPNRHWLTTYNWDALHVHIFISSNNIRSFSVQLGVLHSPMECAKLLCFAINNIVVRSFPASPRSTLVSRRDVTWRCNAITVVARKHITAIWLLFKRRTSLLFFCHRRIRTSSLLFSTYKWRHPLVLSTAGQRKIVLWIFLSISVWPPTKKICFDVAKLCCSPLLGVLDSPRFSSN